MPTTEAMVRTFITSVQVDTDDAGRGVLQELHPVDQTFWRISTSCKLMPPTTPLQIGAEIIKRIQSRPRPG